MFLTQPRHHSTAAILDSLWCCSAPENKKITLVVIKGDQLSRPPDRLWNSFSSPDFWTPGRQTEWRDDDRDKVKWSSFTFCFVSWLPKWSSFFFSELFCCFEHLLSFFFPSTYTSVVEPFNKNYQDNKFDSRFWFLIFLNCDDILAQLDFNHSCCFCGEEKMWLIDTVEAEKKSPTIFLGRLLCESTGGSYHLNWHVSLIVSYWDIIMKLSCTCQDGRLTCLVWFSNRITRWLFSLSNFMQRLKYPQFSQTYVDMLTPPTAYVYGVNNHQSGPTLTLGDQVSVLQIHPKGVGQVEVRTQDPAHQTGEVFHNDAALCTMSRFNKEGQTHRWQKVGSTILSTVWIKRPKTWERRLR